MEQRVRREYLIRELLAEQSFYRNMEVPETEEAQKRLLRALLNVRAPEPFGDEFLHVQDAYLQEEIRKKGITEIARLKLVSSDLYLWKGDITTLKCDGIVNAANSRMLGCFAPNHYCIDNAIHTFAGVQLRNECAEIIKAQGREEPTGRAKITKAYNLPCKFVLHTVGPIVSGRLTEQNRSDLKNCYLSCLELAERNGLRSLAFCCISTGEFHFPNRQAAEIAVRTVKEYLQETAFKIKVIFNVFKETDYEIYAELLGAGQ